MFIKYILNRDGSYTTIRYCRNESDFVPCVDDYVSLSGYPLLKVYHRTWVVDKDVLEIYLMN